ncbi:hypothetical protein EWB00_008929 [Schistosoma japonicum]|uniref:Uncharacterized protein n=2 Tax=Schistosoma japonicum TaxID=6182 RepID=A0A4Z2DSE5_SCHJA|nr:peptidase [Schistosoma japonicum]KAH8876395.1 peptidase [Schistosoma japonicum]TNN19464.1 hypothetical protein EWB00_008929 [Schistosoma japonicum]
MSKNKVRKHSGRRKKYQEVVQSRVNSKAPVQYTRRLKTKKHKKLKKVGADTYNLKIYNRPPEGNDDDYIPDSFKRMLSMKEGKFKDSLDPAVGDTVGMKKKDVEVPVLKQGKHESDAHYLGRLHKEVEDELNKVQFSRKQGTELVTATQVQKSKKKRKAVKRLNDKRKVKRLHAIEKHLTGFEHLKDKVKFNEVVTAPPLHLTKPKMVFKKKLYEVHSLDKMLTT